MSRVRARLRPVLLGLALVALVAGCASIPRSGAVVQVTDQRDDGPSTARYSPAYPQDGASPDDIVRGYLDAMLAYPTSTRTASAFLTPRAARRWQPQAGVGIYRRVEVDTTAAAERARPPNQQSAQIGISLDQRAELDPAGRYSGRSTTRSVDYQLERVDGQWRIDDPQAGVLITSKYFDDYFAPFEVYFFDGALRRLVAEPIHLMVDDRVAASLISSLARGPDDDSLRTVVPSPDGLRSTVPVAEGQASVGLTDEVADPDRVAAQLVWTLRQVDGIKQVRVSRATAGPVADASTFGLDAFAEYAPSSPRSTAYGLQGDRVIRVEGADTLPIDGRFGEDARGAAAVAVSPDRLAAVAGNRRTLSVGPRSGSADVTVEGVNMLDPVVDSDGRFWVLDRPGGAVRVRVVDGPRVREVAVDGLSGDVDVRSFDVSPDGGRYVVTVGVGRGAEVRVGRIVTDADGARRWATAGRLGGVSAPRSAVWTDPVRVGLLADGLGEVQVYTLAVDGSEVTGGGRGGRAMLPDVGAQGVAISPGGAGRPSGTRTLVTTADLELWSLSVGGSWRQLDTDPVSSVSFGG